MTPPVPVEQIRILRHSLGLMRSSTAYRNSYAAASMTHELQSLVDAGLMQRHPMVSWMPYIPLTVTDAGKALAEQWDVWCKDGAWVARHVSERPRASRSAARYNRWLDVADRFPDWGFGDWLKARCPGLCDNG
jgi:DNA-binding HxlR family transcriptional regulator